MITPRDFDAEMRERGLPDYLYKFRKPHDQNFDNLRDGLIWMPSFASLNDPHEGRAIVLLDQAIRNVPAVHSLIFHDQHGRPFPIMRIFGDDCFDRVEVEEDFRKQGLEMQDRMRKTGVYSLCAHFSNSMFDQYAGPDGFCIEYRTRALNADISEYWDCMLPVEYVDSYPEVDLYDLKYGTDIWRARLLLFRKEKRQWQHECEWRIIDERSDIAVSNPFEISSIIFHERRCDTTINRVKEIFADKPVELKIAIHKPGIFQPHLEVIS